MLINAANLDLVFKGFHTVCRDIYDKTPSHHDRIAMTVPSTARAETYGWLGQFPTLREWVGPRHVKNLTASSFTILNRKFESTVEGPRDTNGDGKLGIFVAKSHPDELVFALLAAGFATACYDGQNVFKTDHPVIAADGALSSVSNGGGGSGTPWFPIAAARAVRPIIWQVREDYEFQRKDRTEDDNVFLNDSYL